MSYCITTLLDEEIGEYIKLNPIKCQLTRLRFGCIIMLLSYLCEPLTFCDPLNKSMLVYIR